MLPKALVIMPFIVVITLGLGGDTSIQDNNLQVVIIAQLKDCIA